MGILDGIVEWIAEQIMYGLDMINTSVLGALGCDMNTFLRYFPAAETMYSLLVALAIGLILLGWVWNLFKNYGLGLGVDAEDPVKLTAKAILFIVLAYYADEIVNIALTIGGTPYAWILSSELPSLDFASFNSVLLTIIGVCANGGVALIVLILTLILAWNYITRFVNEAFLSRRRKVCTGVVRIGLKKAVSGSHEYCVATFTKIADFAGEDLAHIRAYADGFVAQIKDINAQRAQAGAAASSIIGDGDASHLELPDNGAHFALGAVIDGEREELPA